MHKICVRAVPRTRSNMIIDFRNSIQIRQFPIMTQTYSILERCFGNWFWNIHVRIKSTKTHIFLALETNDGHACVLWLCSAFHSSCGIFINTTSMRTELFTSGRVATPAPPCRRVRTRRQAAYRGAIVRTIPFLVNIPFLHY